MSDTFPARRLRRIAPFAALVLAVGCMAAPPAESPTPSPSPVGVGPSPTIGATPWAATAAPTEPAPATPPATPSATPPSPATPSATATAAPASPAPVARSPGTGPAGEWTDPVRVSEHAYGEPSLIVDADGIAHITAVRDGGIFHLTNRTGDWTEERLSTPPGTGLQAQADGQPSMAVDSDGTLAVAFTRWGPDDTFGRLPEGVYYTSTRSGGWSEPTLLIDDENGAHSPSLKLRDGRIHLAFVLGVGVDIVTEDMSFPVRYGSAAEDETWRDVEVSPNGTEPILELGADGTPHILFGDEYGLLEADALRLAVGTAGGSFEIEEIDNTSRYARPYDLVLDAGTVRLVWSRPGWASSDDRWAAYHQSRNGSWSVPELLMLDGTARRAALAPDGSIHVVGSNLDGVWYGSGREGTFQTSQLSDRVELWSDVAVGDDGRPHTVFLVGNVGMDELWYTIGPAD